MRRWFIPPASIFLAGLQHQHPHCLHQDSRLPALHDQACWNNNSFVTKTPIKIKSYLNGGKDMVYHKVSSCLNNIALRIWWRLIKHDNGNWRYIHSLKPKKSKEKKRKPHIEKTSHFYHRHAKILSDKIMEQLHILKQRMTIYNFPHQQST